MRHSKLALLAASLCVVTTPAYAYLDPGTGSMILQGIVGALAVGAAYVSIFWHRIKGLFTSRRSSPTPTSSPDAGEP